MPRAPAPFPFASLPKVDRATARLSRRVAAALSAAPRLDTPVLDARWGDLVGDGPLRARPEVPRPVTADSLRAAWSADPTLVARWNHPTLGPFLTALPRTFAFVLVTRALGPDAWSAPNAPWSDVAEGALSALAARAAVALTAPAPPPTLRAVTDHPGDALDSLPAGRPLVAWDVTLTGNTLAGRVTLVLLADELPAAPALRLADVVARFADVSVPVRCVGARSTLGPDAVASLAVGDHLLLDGLRWSPALSGDVTLCVGAHPALRLDATPTDAACVTVASPPRDPWSPAMSDPTDALSAVLVEVTVELASQAVALETLASWGVGAVVEFPQRLGEVVLVRAGGRVIARGELVDVDGQVGVRITART